MEGAASPPYPTRRVRLPRPPGICWRRTLSGVDSVLFPGEVHRRSAMSALENAEVAIQPNGASADARERIAVENPATGEVVGYVDDVEPAAVAAMVDRARAAQPGWEALEYEG